MSYTNCSNASASRVQELTLQEIEAVSGADDKQTVCYASAAGGGAVSVGGMILGIAAATTPVGMAIAVGLGMAGLFASSAGAATCR